jgi:hypothetical protein
MENDGKKSEIVKLMGNKSSVFQQLNKEELIQNCRELKSAVDKAEREIEAYRELLTKTLSEYDLFKSRHPDIEAAEYNKRWSWVNKIVYVLKKVRRPLLSSEIISFITPYETVLQHSHHRAQAFSANLNKAVKYGRVIPYKLGGSRGYYYILPDWRDHEGRIMGEYENKIFFK